MIGTMVFGFAVALLLNQRLRGNVFFAHRRAAAVGGAGARGQRDLASGCSTPATASSTGRWSSSASTRFQDYAWFAGAQLSAYVAIFVTVVWQSFPFIALSLLAGLQTMPQETLARRRASTARTPWQRFRLVTLPLLRPIVAVLVIFSTIWDFKIFDQIYVMAAGRAGPRAPTPRRSPPTARASRSATTGSGARSPSCCS